MSLPDPFWELMVPPQIPLQLLFTSQYLPAPTLTGILSMAQYTLQGWYFRYIYSALNAAPC